MTRAVADAPATHFRLSEESWALIAEAYRGGATARELAARWKVSPTTIYRYACRDGFTKKRHSDAVARAHAQATVEGGAVDNEARRLVGLAPVPALPAPPPPAANPEALKQRAMEDLARAMAAGRVAEAERLGRLLLTLGKVGDLERSGEGFDEDGYPVLTGPLKTTFAEVAEMVYPFACEIALKMLGDRWHGPEVFSRAVMRWRAETFGPETAANDYREMCKGGWTDTVYDADGNILPGWDSQNLHHPMVDPPPGYRFEDATGPYRPGDDASPETASGEA
ncbi:MAG: helix-turn-helix domain-containing protein [Caulobacter sp.]|nr:helix-turn-helix domain-containing protein [Caulobacter sp.]